MPVFSIDNESGQQYSNVDIAFAKSILNDIRRNQRLPIELKVDDVFHAIQTQTDWWYDQCPYATEDDQLYFDLSIVPKCNATLDKDGQFKLLTNEVLLPSAVFDVYELFYATDGYWSTGQMSLAQWRLESILIDNVASPENMFGVDSYMASLFCSNLVNSIDKEPVLFDYNQLTRKLKLYDNGTRSGHIICKVARKLQPSDLYKDLWYRRYIIAHVISAKADQIELFGASLPGDLSINIGVLRERADKLLDMVNQHLEAENDNDFYITKT